MRPFSDVDLHAFVDDQVSPERRALIAAYLQATPAEAARVQGWRRQNEAIRSVFAGAATEPVPLWLTIGQVASGRERDGKPVGYTGDGQALRPVPLRRSVPLRQPARRTWMVAMLAALAFGAGASMPAFVPQWSEVVDRVFPAAPRAEQIRRVAARTLEAHRTFAMDADRPAEVIDEPRGTLATWLRRRLGNAVRVPDLSRLGWTLRGGRVVPGDLGPGAMMIYEDAVGDRLSLVTVPVNNPSLPDTSYTVAGPVLAWLDGPVGIGVTASKEGPWLSDNARALYRGIYAGMDD